MKIRHWLGILGFVCAAPAVSAFDILQPLPDSPIIPANNPQNQAKIDLGKQLFFDNRLSVDHSLSCNSCHNLASGGDDDGGATRLPSRHIKRSAPPVYNVGHMSVYFWDGRAKSLEDMAIDHLFAPHIMANDNADSLEQRLRQIPGYAYAFKQAFEDGLTLENITKSLAAFLRTLNTPNSAFDQYVRGDKQALGESAKRGLHIFNEYGCMSCHFGVNLAGPAPGPAFKMGDGFYELFPNHTGSEYDEKYDIADDVGRVLVTRDSGHIYMWRVPQLRNIANTAPYFHNGSVNSLDEAVRVMAKTQLQLTLNHQDVEDIVAFLESLTGEYPQISLPRLPETPGKSIAK